MAVDRTTGKSTVLAGATTAGCIDAPVGADARFSSDADYPVLVAGSDGTYIYITDACGLRRVDPATGATSTITSDRYLSISIAGQKLYAWGHAGYRDMLYTWDLTTGTILHWASPPGGIWGAVAIAADNTSVWIVGGNGDSLYRLNPVTSETTRVGTPPLGWAPTRTLLSVGDYLYTTLGTQAFPDARTRLIRISKSDGSAELIAGQQTAGDADGLYADAQFSNITGIASDGTDIFVADSADASGSVRQLKKAKLPVDNGGPSLWRETAGGYNPSLSAPCVAACHADPVQTDTGALFEPATDAP